MDLAPYQPHDPEFACGEIGHDDPVGGHEWLVEGCNGKYGVFDVSHLYWAGTISLETRVWCGDTPGWRKLGDVWDMRMLVPAITALPPDPWSGSRLDHYPGPRGWVARRKAGIRAWRLRLFDAHLYRCGYRTHLSWLWRDLVERPSPERTRLLQRWWRRAGLPLRSWVELPSANDLGSALQLARDREVFRSPGWLRAKLAGVHGMKAPLWVSLWRRALRLLAFRKPSDVSDVSAGGAAARDHRR